MVLIDDLDRCEPDAAYRLLEGLKIYLTVRNCVFVLGMNQKILEGAIGENVPSGDGEHVSRERAAAYLEKLCQNVWRLPSVRNPKKLLCEFLPGADVKRCIGEAIGELHCLPPNPRRIKGLANLIQRVWSRLDRQFLNRDDSELIHEAKLILVVAYVHQFHHDLFLHWEANPELYHPLLEWVRGYEKSLPVIERLKRPYVIKTDETTTTPEYDMTSAYPDPTGSNVFWVQPLIHELGKDARIEDFARYLHGAR